MLWSTFGHLLLCSHFEQLEPVLGDFLVITDLSSMAAVHGKGMSPQVDAFWWETPLVSLPISTNYHITFIISQAQNQGKIQIQVPHLLYLIIFID